jgi:hypothetical protein
MEILRIVNGIVAMFLGQKLDFQAESGNFEHLIFIPRMGYGFS